MSADDKHLQWLRVNTCDMVSLEGRYILGGKSTREWADYGRWFALLQLMARSSDGCIDVGDPRRLKSLAADLALSPKACRDWLAVLVEGGAIDRDNYEQGRIFVADVFNAVQAYNAQVRANKRNGTKGGRPRKRGNNDTEDTQKKPNG